jgi:hypothetical protein
LSDKFRTDFRDNFRKKITMPSGIDTPETMTLAEAKELYSADVRFVGRYYSSSAWKRLTPAEAKDIKAAGLFIVSIWEDGPTQPLYFSAGRGDYDISVALGQAHECGQPKGSSIFGTVDFDCPEANIPQILNYAEAFHAVNKNAGYNTGWYGSGLVLQKIKDAGYGNLFMLAESTGWTGYQKFRASGQATIVQSIGGVRNGINYDGDQSNGAGGGWMTEL